VTSPAADWFPTDNTTTKQNNKEDNKNNKNSDTKNYNANDINTWLVPLLSALSLLQANIPSNQALPSIPLH
jgi:hypothetical protein